MYHPALSVKVVCNLCSPYPPILPCNPSSSTVNVSSCSGAVLSFVFVFVSGKFNIGLNCSKLSYQLSSVKTGRLSNPQLDSAWETIYKGKM